jgi:hypothetical protein
VQTIKLVVPSFLRSWNPVRREWLILEPVYAAELAGVLRGAGHIIVGGINDPSDVSCQGWAQHLFRAVGPARSTAVYRALSRCLHPDTPTGDTTLQRELNDAYNRLEKRTA